jgi:hypothetical protein
LTESTHSYLLLVDTSVSMRREAVTVRNLVHDLIHSGLGGAMRAGDIFAVWTFSDEVYLNRFRAQAWLPELNQAFANRTYEFLRRERCERRRRMDRAVTTINQLLRTTDPLTVLLISDGSDTVAGTPFDRELNTFYQAHYREWYKARKPFVTTLVGRHGQWVAWAVNGPGEPINMPDAPPTLARAANAESTAPPPNPSAPPTTTANIQSNQPRPATASPTLPTNQPPIQHATAKPEPTPTPIAVAPSPAKVELREKPASPAPIVTTPTTKETVPAPKPTVPPPAIAPASLTSTAPPPITNGSPQTVAQPAPTSAAGTQASPAPVRAAPVATSPPVSPPATVTQTVAAKTNDAPLPVASPRVAIPPSSPSGTPETGRTPPQPQPTLAASDTHARILPTTNRAAPKPGPEQIGVVVSPPPASGRGLLFVGVGLAVVALGLVTFMLRRGRVRPGATLITRSIDDRGK